MRGTEIKETIGTEERKGRKWEEEKGKGKKGRDNEGKGRRERREMR